MQIKTTAILILIILGITDPCHAESLVSKENRVILNESCESPWIDIQWVPSDEQTDDALTVITRFLNEDESVNAYGRQQALAAAEIRKHSGDYRVQFSGIIENDINYIQCNFFPVGRTFSSDWRTEYICAFDSGFWYWNILYDPATKEVSRFQINGLL